MSQVSAVFSFVFDLFAVAVNLHARLDVVMPLCFFVALEELVLVLQVFVAQAFEIELVWGVVVGQQRDEPELVLEVVVGQMRNFSWAEEGENEVEEDVAKMVQSVGVVYTSRQHVYQFP
eukprot:CAMPEP_0196243422 /NCGR_PEP_ID=MMETSP0913-20130531/27896_1 /TAXON_ID=49265 /ORGANISM="Thalassiosira rotula, Strain GSO102" /LENGTH=118 /DNA_ID=CAMNT_0041526967 /DNA_START=315 /DNA_END=668 /DNA_ORIENTATION=-